MGAKRGSGCRRKGGDGLENGKNKIKDYSLAVIVALLASTIVFYIWDVPEWLYFLVLLGVWLFFLLQFPMGKNIGLYSRFLVCSAVNSLAYFCITLRGLSKSRNDNVLLSIESSVKALYGITDAQNNTALYGFELHFIVFYALLVLMFSSIQLINAEDFSGNKTEEAGTNKSLFIERHNDLNRLREYLDNFSIVGLNGDWGSGKSFLTDHLEEFHIIKIDPMSCNLEEIQTLVVRELDKVLKEEGVLSPFSPKIRKMLNQGGLLEKIAGLFVKNDVSFTEALKGFHTDLNHLSECMLIVFEDIDRIEDTDVIKKILAISEKLAGGNIKILYHFSEDNLYEKGIDRAYLEKYIPFTVKLTEIPFRTLMAYVFDFSHHKDFELKKEDLDFLKSAFFMHIGSNTYEGKFIAYNITIRRMKHLSEETNRALIENGEYRDNRRTVLSFFIIKHFCDQLYMRLEMGKSLLDMALFHYKEQTLSYRELEKQFVDNDDGLWEALNAPENQQALSFFCLLDYQPSRNKNGKIDPLNEKIDRLISSLLGSGKSELTDSEYVIRYLFNNVLNAPQEEWMQRFKEMTDKLHSGEPLNENKNDNRTIFRLGEDEIIGLSRAMENVEKISQIKRTSDEWMKFFEFIFQYYDKPYIDTDLIQCLTYCTNIYRSCYIYILEQFNQLEIRYNFNNKAYYAKFLIEYLGNLSVLGFCDTEIVTLLDENKIDPSTCNDVFDVLEKDLSSYKSVDLPDLQRDLTIVRNFIEKNRDLIANETSAPRSDYKLNITFSSAPPPKEEEALGDIELDEDFQKQLEQYYKDGKLKPYQAERAWNKRKSKKN